MTESIPGALVEIESALATLMIQPTRLTPMSGNTTGVWRVDTAEASYVLRRRHQREAERVRSTHSLLRYLAPLGIAPRPVESARGATVDAPSGAIYEVLTFVPGEVSVTGWDFDWDDDELLASAGELLGQLNVALRSYDPAPASSWYARPATPSRLRLEGFLATEGTPEAQQILSGLGPLYTRLERPSSDRTRSHIVHNDFAWYNVARTGRRSTGVIDFDSAQPNTELHDIAYAAYAFAPITEQIGGRTRSAARAAERVAIFIHAYEGVAGPLQADPDALLDTAAHRVALSAAALLAGLVEGEERSRRLLSHAVGYVQWLEWFARTRPDLLQALSSTL